MCHFFRVLAQHNLVGILKKNNIMNNINVSVFILVVATILWIRDVYIYINKTKNGIVKNGIVKDIIFPIKSNGVPIIEFDYNGDCISGKPIRFIYDPTYLKNQVVEIYINPENPYDFVIKNKKVINIATVIFLFNLSLSISIFLFV
jgi:hypothetical protein